MKLYQLSFWWLFGMSEPTFVWLEMTAETADVVLLEGFPSDFDSVYIGECENGD